MHTYLNLPFKLYFLPESFFVLLAPCRCNCYSFFLGKTHPSSNTQLRGHLLPFPCVMPKYFDYTLSTVLAIWQYCFSKFVSFFLTLLCLACCPAHSRFLISFSVNIDVNLKMLEGVSVLVSFITLISTHVLFSLQGKTKFNFTINYLYE
jgi:hypothetical protein